MPVLRRLKSRSPGTGSPQTGGFTPSGAGDVTQAEFPGQEDEADGPGPYPGTIVNRSLSPVPATASRSTAARRPSRTRTFNTGFEGLNLYQQRYARGGNQFSVEPPDQALCAGNGYVLEAVNDVLNVFNTPGQSVLPDNTATNIVGGFPRNVNHAVDLNSFYGYPPAINRTTGVRGQFVTDPTLPLRRGDAALLRRRPDAGDASDDRRVHTASTTSTSRSARRPNPTGAWNIYRIDVTNDGTNTGGVNPGPYLGDYPHIGADANGFYITTNAYPWCCNGFSGAQIYALLEGAARRRRRQRDDGAHRHLRHGQRAERRRRDAAGLHRLAGAVARARQFNTQQRRHRVLPELERRRRGHASGGRHRRQLRRRTRSSSGR